MPRKRTKRGERKIEKRAVGPYWQPGDEHPLDVLDAELAEVRGELPGLLEEVLTAAQRTQIRLTALIHAEQASPDPEAPFAAADQQARSMIVSRFHNRKHLHHLITLFLLQRRKRLLGRLHTIQAALDLVNGLLDEEETLSQEFLSSWSKAAATAISQPGEGIEESEPGELQDEEGERQPALTREQRRMQGIEEPLEPILSSVDQSRRHLREFEAQLPELRKQLASGRGWFEVYSVHKRRFRQEVVAYTEAMHTARKQHTTIPSDIVNAVHPDIATLIEAESYDVPKELQHEFYTIIDVGPYVKYRWTENKQTYTISLGLDDDYPPYPFTPQGF